jgi:hypothetical protein
VSYIFAGKSQLALDLTLDILNRDLGVRIRSPICAQPELI